MLEKTSLDTKCKYCDNLAVFEIKGIPVCEDCKGCSQLQEDLKIYEAFTAKGDIDNE